MLRFSFRKNETVVVEEPFGNLDIQSRNTMFSLGLSHPFYKTVFREFQLGLTADYRKSSTFLLHRPYAFSDGPEDGRTSETVLRLFQEWFERSEQQVIALKSSFNAGVDAFNATHNATGADGKFFSWNGQMQWLRRIGDRGLQAHVRTDLQLTSDRLLSAEKFSVGGLESVRGFRKNALVADNGISASVELRVPLFRTEKREEILQLIPFIDYGRAWNSGDAPAAHYIAGAGAGIKWAITNNIIFQFFWGAALKDNPVSRKDLQDRGLHFKLTARLI
jgi:hemolysin activation/secretion protein